MKYAIPDEAENLNRLSFVEQDNNKKWNQIQHQKREEVEAPVMAEESKSPNSPSNQVKLIEAQNMCVEVELVQKKPLQIEEEKVSVSEPLNEREHSPP